MSTPQDRTITVEDALRDGAGSWTGWPRRRALHSFPPDQLLPERQPIYVASWIYVFGVATLAAFLVVLGSGVLLALRGPEWWHAAGVGHYVNSFHLWSVELFMGFMVIHLWGKFFMAAWRGRRSIGTAVHRVSDPTEPRFAVDCHLGQRRLELGGSRRVLQCA